MLDIIAITILIIFFIRGYMKGIIVAVFSMLAVILGIICAMKLSGMLSLWLVEKGWVSSGWVQLISYILLFTGVLLLVGFIGKAVQASAKMAMMGWLNGVLGGVVYAFLGAVIWSSLLWIGNKMTLVRETSKEASRTYRYLEPLAPWVFEKTGKLLPFAKDVFSDLSGFFDTVEQPSQKDVGTDR
jgi:membrane protein required for colicin V production